jgi:hypothetical protein
MVDCFDDDFMDIGVNDVMKRLSDGKVKVIETSLVWPIAIGNSESNA